MTINELITMQEELEPETIRKFFPLMSSLEVQQIQVLKILNTTMAAYEDMDVFEDVVAVLNGVSPNIGVMEGSTPEFIWRALDIIFGLHPNLELSWDVEHYTKYIFNDNGYYFYHPKLKLENELLDDVIKKATSGPFPLEETFIGIQAGKYLKILEYINQAKRG